MKEVPKYLKKTEKKKSKWPLVLVVIGVTAIAAVCVILFLRGAQPESGNARGTENSTGVETTVAAETEQTAEATEPVAYTQVKTNYVLMQIPEQYAGELTHREVTGEDCTMEIFSMKTENGETELFRIYFGDGQTGNALGTMKIDGVEVPVTVSVCEYSEDYFADEETRDLYYEMMDSLNDVIRAVQSDERFITEKNIAVEKNDNQLSYWTFSLPEGVEFEEAVEGERYQVTFFGNVNGERHMLYAVALGDPTMKNVLGTCQVDGVGKTVSIESYDLPDTEGWTENAVMELYKMMESINDVIQVIMAGENFSEQVS